MLLLPRLFKCMFIPVVAWTQFALPEPALSQPPDVEPTQQQERPEWQILWQKAERYESSHDYRSAEDIYRKILGQPQPNSMRDNIRQTIQVAFGRNLEKQGKFKAALKLFKQVATMEGVIPIYRDQANDSLGRISKLIKASRKSVRDGLRQIKAAPSSQQGYVNLLSGLATQGQAEQVFLFLEQKLGERLSFEQMMELARAAQSLSPYRVSHHIYHRRSALAISLYRQIIQRHPDHQQARTALLDLVSLYASSTEAILAIREEIRRRPQTIRRYWRPLIGRLERIGRREEARQVFNQLLQEKTIATSTVYLELGRFLERVQKSDEALEIYFKAIEAFPLDTPTFRQCHVVRETAYDRLVTFLERQQRLHEVPSLMANNISNPQPIMYNNLGLALGYEGFQDLQAKIYRQMQTHFPETQIQESSGC